MTGCPNQCTGHRSHTPGPKISICERPAGGIVQIQFLGVSSIGGLSKQRVIDTLGIDPAGGADIHGSVVYRTCVHVNAVILNGGGTQGGIHRRRAGIVIVYAGIAFEDSIQLFGQRRRIGIVAA